ncbi:LytR/AlgR family response regulator transcription factor [Salinibacter altiplanensis]|uniref:LytR/AlgR family response regulator transcription factor n=1 Tax=Salinibacter altiplanensis TaxID=1803181 RepID=UPI000C9F39A9|nr:LytTR family DNA-binding domain-containing protein [Salinibacter altiplanensis]
MAPRSLLRTLIVDDERLARRELRRLLEPRGAVTVVGAAATAEEAEAAIHEDDPDLLLLDVQMPGGGGFDLLERLDAVPHVVFVTAYDEYAIRAFEVNALDYLVKPVEPKRLAEAIGTVRERAAEPVPEAVGGEASRASLTADDQVFVKDGEQCWFVQLADVRLFETAGNYTRLYFDGEEPLIHRSLNYLEERLDPDRFFRASRQHIFNLRWVEDVTPGAKDKLKATLGDGTEVELSRRRSRAFREQLRL